MYNPQLDDCCGMGFVGDEDGFFYCPVCGSQSQDTFHTSLEVDSVYRDSFYGRVVENSSRSEPIYQTQSQEFKVPKVEPTPNSFLDDTSVPLDFGNPKRPVLNAEELSDGIRLRYIQGMQVMIQMQCETLVEKFGVSAMICGIAGTIWLRFVAVSGVLADDWVNDSIMESEIRYQNRQGDEEDTENVSLPAKRRHKSELYNLYGQRGAVVWFKTLRRQIPRASSLAVSFLACHLARESVLPTDIEKWTLEGKLPYLAAFADIEKHIGSPSHACPFSSRSMFRPPRAIRSWYVESLAGSIAHTIGLRLPPVNFYSISSRFLNQLLPIEKIFPQARFIFEWLMPPDLWLSANPNKLPTRACVMSILIVAIRILYNIHGYGIWEMSLSKGREASKSSSDTKTSEYNTIDLLYHLEEIYHRLGDKHEYSNDLATYLKYCKDIVFPGLVMSYEEEKIAEQLWNFYKSDEDIKTSVEAQTGCDAFNQKRHGVAKHDIRSLGDKTFDSREQIKSQVNKSNSVHAEAILDRDDHGTRPVMKGETSSSGGENSLPEDIALRRLIADMEENNFNYIPPRGVRSTSRKEGYLFYKRVIVGGIYNYVAHADYYILLRACARIVRVDVRVMHVSVQRLERRLARVDEWIDKVMQMTTDLSSQLRKPDRSDVDDADRLNFSGLKFNPKF